MIRNIGFGPNAVRALELIGPEVAEAYNKVCTANLWPEKSHIWYDVRDGKNGGELVCEIETGPGFVHGGASRAHFLDGLVGLIPSRVKTEFGKKVVDVQEGGGKMKVIFEDRLEVWADAVVGCDGVRSTCRRVLLGEDEKSARAVYSGKYAYRKVVEMEKAVAVAGREIENRTIFFGHGGHILMFPIRDGKFLNIVAFVDAKGQPWTDQRWVIPASRDEVLKDYEGWDKPATSILEVRLPEFSRS
jgi:salicylate hydroxylase